MDKVNPAETAEIQVFRRPADLVGKRPATVVASSRVVAGRTEILGAIDRWQLVAEMHRAERHGEIKVIRRGPVWSTQRGQYEVIVRRLKDPPPRWRRPLLAGGVALVVLGVLAGVGALLARSTLGQVVMGAAALLLAMVAFNAMTRLGQRGGHAAVDVRVEVRVR